VRVTPKKPHFFDPVLRVEMMDRNGFDFQVVTPPNYLDPNCMPADSSAQLQLAKAVNENMTRLSEVSGGRLIGIGTIPLIDFEKGPSKELERAIRTLGLKGINLPSNVFGRPLDAPEFEPFWAQASAMGVPVFIHPVDPEPQRDRAYEKEYDMTHNFGWPFETILTLARLVFSGVMGKYPELKIISHHLGGGIPFLWGRISETYASNNREGHPERNLSPHLTKPLYDYFRSFYYDTAVGGGGPAVRCTREVFGADRIVFATDAPWGPGTGEVRLVNYPEVIRSLGFTNEEDDKIFAGNIRNVLGL